MIAQLPCGVHVLWQVECCECHIAHVSSRHINVEQPEIVGVNLSRLCCIVDLTFSFSLLTDASNQMHLTKSRLRMPSFRLQQGRITCVHSWHRA